MAHTKNKKQGSQYTFAAGIYGDNLEADSTEEGFALGARGTYAFSPADSKNTLVHFGGSLRYREKGDTAADLRYRQRPFAHIPGRVVSTGRIADSDTFYGVEAAGIFDQFWAAGEYGVINSDTTTGSDADLQGYYLEAGYFFGGKKTYKDGKFGRPCVYAPIARPPKNEDEEAKQKRLSKDSKCKKKSDNGTGAFSVVVRYDSIDLSDSSVNGGELDTLILGADWWPTENTRIGLNYFNGDVVYGASTSGLDSAFAAEVTAGTVDDNVSGVVTRLQFDF